MDVRIENHASHLRNTDCSWFETAGPVFTRGD